MRQTGEEPNGHERGWWSYLSAQYTSVARPLSGRRLEHHPHPHQVAIAMRVNAPRGAMILEALKDAPGRLPCERDLFWKKNTIGPLSFPGRYKKTIEKHAPLTRTQQGPWQITACRFGTGDRPVVVEGVGIADGSRANYDVRI